MTTIKFKAGDVVYWLSSTGFTKGWIKTIRFEQEFVSNKRKSSLLYFLTNENNDKLYQGDKVTEGLVFSSYGEMLAHYSKEPV